MSHAYCRREDLASTDLVVDAVYEGGRSGNAGDDPLGPLLGVSNQGGFRHLGRKELPHLLVITSSMNEPDWPDHLDFETGLFTYYGDNRRPGRDLHETPRWGNEFLRDLFARVHGSSGGLRQVPPVLVFRNAGTYRDVVFVGLAVPGAPGMPLTEDLVAVWHHANGQRFQNYRAVFTILDVGRLTRAWLNDVRAGNPHTSNAPRAWSAWVKGGQADALRSTPTIRHRTKAEQLPETDIDRKILAAVYERFRGDEYEFEECATQIAEMLLPGIVDRDLTRRSRDGGRDAIGKYRIGSDATGIRVDFALEAKCKAADNAVGVKETSRLISRLRHREFGIFVTTSHLNLQAYEEIVEDSHPVLIVCGRDIVSILKQAGMRDEKAVKDWLEATFSSPARRLPSAKRRRRAK